MRFACCMLIGCFAWLGAHGAVIAEPVDYARDIKPILEKHCYECHGLDTQESGLRLDTASLAIEGGYSGAAIVPGKSGESLLVKAITGGGDIKPMPYESEPLVAGDIELLRRWIDQGATHPADERPLGQSGTSQHWAFQPIRRPPLPRVKQAGWPRGAMDRFILAKLEAAGFEPSPEADRPTLIRRVMLDLVGLPPTWKDVERFVHDTRPDAYERLVDRLLASPSYGERWGRHWLDVARYADSDGYTVDGPRSIWKYRDWVVEALNRDLPFDRFTIEQLAGDLLPGATRRQMIATGFHRNTLINHEGGTDQEQFRVEAVVDRVNTTGVVFLGLTIGCARCHDHKFDPLTQQDFYRLFAFYNNCDEPQLELPTPRQQQQQARLQGEIAQVDKRLAAHDAEWEAALNDWEAGLTDDARQKLPDPVKAVFDTPPDHRDVAQRKTLLEASRKFDAKRKALVDQIAALKAKLPKPVTTMILRRRAEPRTTHILIRGDFLRPGKEVTPGTPAVLPSLNLPSDGRPLTRLDLARWLVHKDNPLTPRVTMNRLWQHYFGRGLVATENDFGTQGAPPTHPELLDWLAGEFVRRGWSLKAMHRLIVSSSTYRQSSDFRASLAEIDPRNKLLGRQSRLRLEAEAIRDSALAVAGTLSPKMGGPSVFPYQPDGVMGLAQVKRAWKMSPGEDRYRRTMYTFFWRSTPHPLLKMFDAPNAIMSCTRRDRSNTPLQSLTLLNDAEFVACARKLAAHILAEGPHSDTGRITFAVRRCLAREPTKYETLRLLELAEQVEPGEAPSPETVERDRWTAVARVLLNVDEFVTRP